MTDGPSLSRRGLLGAFGAGAAATVATASGLLGRAAPAYADEIGPATGRRRRRNAYNVRVRAARLAASAPFAAHPDNGDERDVPYFGSYHKGLPHDPETGDVDPAAYRALLAALRTGTVAAFESVPMGGVRKQVNPLAGLAYDLEGPDSHDLGMRVPPKLASAEFASEAAEMYWHALLRDVPFTEYDSHPLVAEAAADLSRFSDFRGPRRSGSVTPDTLFRQDLPGCLTGPWMSQFLLRDIPYGSLTIEQRNRVSCPTPDFMTDFAEWVAIQNGAAPSASDVFDPVRRYIRNGRDLASYVHVDALYEAYLNAALILLGMGAPANPANPYAASSTMTGFGSFGPPHILSLVTEAATRALKAVWYQKWFVHRRLRPEAAGGLIHRHFLGTCNYTLHDDLFASPVLDRTQSRFGSALLPQAFPEGSPLHPSFGSGHTTVAGACITILKWYFDERWVLPDAVIPDADGTALVPWTGSGNLTVGGELNKVASNVAIGRDFAGIHWRSDSTDALYLGEDVALGILREQKLTYAENADVSFTKLDGTRVTV